MHIASFAGIAPVNNPVIAVAVVIDNPRNGPSYYGTAVSAPVFAEVAQEVLEYLNVPHDIDVRPAKTDVKQAKAEKPEREDDSDADQSEVNALFAAANDLPADDPLRQRAVAPRAQNERQHSLSKSGRPSPNLRSRCTTNGCINRRACRRRMFRPPSRQQRRQATQLREPGWMGPYAT